MKETYLQDYFNRHRQLYINLANNCSSVAELLLKVAIYGKIWTSWDWAIFFTVLQSPAMLLPADSHGIAHIKDLSKNIENQKYLCKDILESIDCTDMLDHVMTNRNVIINMIETAKQYKSFYFGKRSFNRFNCQILAHVFKKYPELWNMNWMQTKFYNQQSKRWIKLHRLQKFITVDKSLKIENMNSYMFNEFQKIYFDCISFKTDEEK